MKQYIIPIFIPYSGCPHRCIFCNQKKITGENAYLNTETIKKIIDNWLSLSAQLSAIGNRQIAFYGGSFTALPLERQELLLSSVLPYLNDGVIDSIRLSTRPDSITIENLAILKKYRVKTVELGVQSMDDSVLSLSERGHSADDIRSSCKLLKSHGFEVGIQIMPGLPGDTFESSLYTAYEVMKLKPDFVRIYPAVVIKNTGLADLYLSGSFKPLSLGDAVRLAKYLLIRFEVNNIPVIRIGLQPASSLMEKDVILDGPFHPAFRQLVESEIAYDMMKHIIKGQGASLPLQVVSRGGKGQGTTFFISHRELSNFIGQKRSNIKKIESEFDFKVDIKSDSNLKSGEAIFDNSLKKIYIKRKEVLKEFLSLRATNNAITGN
ncbi:MAG: radical SAM protein [Nitrospinae bacterium]|nr:radical SAM protein [Nitrospinota bacterium]